MKRTSMLSLKIGKKSLANRWQLLLLIVFLWGVSQPLRAAEVLDAGGKKVQLVATPQRIVTLAPSLAELAADLLGDELERIVGVSEFTDYPPGLKKVASIGPFNHVSVERVVSLKPDLVLATTDGNSKEQIEQLRELKVPVVVVKTDDFEQIGESILIISRSLGVPALGQKMAARLKVGLENLHERSKNRKRVKILLQIGESPLVVVGGGTFLDRAIQKVGAENVFQDSKIRYPRPSMEDIVIKDPEVIVILIMGDGASRAEAQMQSWMPFTTLQAVKNHRVRILHSEELLRPSLRILEGLSLLERTIHGTK
jgi:iron complex transport system substrate-binding protein